MGVRSALRNLLLQPDTEPERQINPYSWNQFLADYNSAFTYNGARYGTMAGDNETIDDSFEGLIAGAVKSNGVVFGCMLARQMVFSDARFVFREMRNGTPGDLVGNPDGRNPASNGLRLLQRPWSGGTTGDLLSRMIQDADVAGNAFIARRNGQLARLRPDWVTIVAETPGDASLWHPDAQILGYIYNPGGAATDDQPIAFPREEVAHFAPIPDPQQRFRGMSWLEPILVEILSDKSMTRHKQAFFDQGATVNMVLKYNPEMTRELFDFAKNSFDQQHSGVGNAYKTLHLLGAEPFPVGSTMEQMDFKTVQGHGETRIAAAAGVPPIIVGLSEGLEAATYSNYGQARRAFADRTIRPLWRNACASLAQIIPSPANSELWYDDSDVAFIREDQKDAADIQQVQSQASKALIEAGWEPSSVVDYITSGDMKRLKHTGLFSTLLQPPGTTQPKPDPALPGTAGGTAAGTATPVVQKGVELAYLEQRANRAEIENMMLQAALDRATGQQQLPITINNNQPEVVVHTPSVNVEGPSIELGDTTDVATPEVRMEPHFEVNTPDVNVTSPPVNVDVNTPEVRVEPHFEVNTPDVNITAPPVNVDVHTPEVRVDVDVAAPDPTPVEVNVEPPAVTNEVRVDVEPTPLDVRVDSPVNVEVPEQAPPQVNITMPKGKRRVTRDEGKVV
jgi:phage portal protein BeeE